MLRIGDFAGITGLSVKALRHYDEKSVLVPDAVDDGTRYRLYSEGQVRSGVVVRALRSAGVALPTIRSVDDPQTAIDVLDAHRQQVHAERAEQDLAYADALQELRALTVPVRVEERAMPREYYAGRVLSATAAEADELTDDDANDAFSALYEQLVTVGAKPTGRFWTTLRTAQAGQPGQIDLVGCWELSAPLDAPWDRADGETGMLHARQDLVAIWQPESDEELPAGATHPAMVALFDALHERGLSLRKQDLEIRQTVVTQADGSYQVEVALGMNLTV